MFHFQWLCVAFKPSYAVAHCMFLEAKIAQFNLKKNKNKNKEQSNIKKRAKKRANKTLHLDVFRFSALKKRCDNLPAITMLLGNTCSEQDQGQPVYYQLNRGSIL